MLDLASWEQEEGKGLQKILGRTGEATYLLYIYAQDHKQCHSEFSGARESSAANLTGHLSL